MEGLNNINKIESKVETLPIVELKEFKSKRYIEDKGCHKIFKFVREVGIEDGAGNKREVKSYFLNEDIGEHKYFIQLIEDYHPERKGNYGFSFETEYGYYRIKLNKEENEKLFSKIKSFFESVYNDDKKNFRNIWMVFSNAGITKEEIDTCINQILKLDKDKSREELFSRGKDYLLEEYRRLYGEDFKFTENSKKFQKLRMRLFTSIFRKSFDNWKYCTDEDIILGTRLVLSRK